MNILNQFTNLIKQAKQNDYKPYKCILLSIPAGETRQDETLEFTGLKILSYNHLVFHLSLNNAEEIDYTLPTAPFSFQNFPIFKYKITNNDPAVTLNLILFLDVNLNLVVNAVDVNNI